MAERLSATPYIYAYDLNVDAALWGWTGGAPDEAQQAKIRAIQAAHLADFDRRIRENPPAAFVFFDKSPLISTTDAWQDFTEHVPGTAPFVRERYRKSASFGNDHVWLRRDLAEEAEKPSDIE
jgi:hypothetical protein